MDQERQHHVDWIIRRCELLQQKKQDAWETLSRMTVANSIESILDSLFSELLAMEIEVCRLLGIRAHLEGKVTALAYNDSRINHLFDEVHKHEVVIIEHFEQWKENRAAALSFMDFSNWRDAMAIYFQASPGEI